MAETAEQLHARVAAATASVGRLAPPPVEGWDTWPFEGV
jgi:hypothetical protein